MLHTVNKSPFERRSLASCLRYAREGDAVLFYEDGVYALRVGAETSIELAAAKHLNLYALGPDLEARGIGAGQVLKEVKIVDYGGFVDLAAENGPVQSWL